MRREPMSAGYRSADLVEMVPAGAAPETAGSAHPPRPAPAAPPQDRALREWAEQLNVSAAAWQPELQRLIEELGIGPGSTVLDAGCGPGRITGWLADRVAPTGRVNAIDPDVPALEYAAWWLGGLTLAGIDIELGASSVEALPFGADTFDAAWCSGVLPYVDDPQAALEELVRVVRPGGRIVVVTGDAGRATWLPIGPDLELVIRRAELAALDSGAWGAVDLHVGRRLHQLATGLPVTRSETRTVVWERTAPLLTEEAAYLHALLAWLGEPESRRWFGEDWDRCRRLVDPQEEDCLLQRTDLHILQTTTALVLTV